MIRVERVAKPAILIAKEAIWLDDLSKASSDKKKSTAAAKYRHKQIKAALVDMFAGKCAYCESVLRHIDYGDVEHFRPKSKTQFANLIFSWTNLLLSCKVCNGAEHKGSEFAEEDQGGPLVDPTIEEPSDHLDFIYDPIAKLATVTYKTERGRVTRELLQLNRPTLRIYRSSVVRKLYMLASLAPQNDEALALLEAVMNFEPS